MDIPKTIKQFNNLLHSFLVQISPLIGSHYLTYYKTFIKMNTVAPINFFIDNIYIHKNQILNKDENYFKNDKDVLKHYTNDQNKLNEIFKLRGLYNKIDNESRNNTWTYLHALIGLTEEYIILKK
jgi:hypothetical protein